MRTSPRFWPVRLALGLVYIGIALRSQAAEITTFLAVSKKGNCTVREPKKEQEEELRIDTPYPFGATLKTGRKSWALIQFSKNNRFRLLPRTRLVITLNVRNPKFKRIKLARGTVEVTLDSFPEGHTFDVETPSAVCGAVGTRFSVGYDQGPELRTPACSR